MPKVRSFGVIINMDGQRVVIGSQNHQQFMVESNFKQKNGSTPSSHTTMISVKKYFCFKLTHETE